jgi:hypothetical protein
MIWFGVGLLWHYDIVYWLTSQGTHASAIALEEYLDVAPDGSPVFKLGLSAKGLRGDLTVCCELLVRGLMLMNDVCKFDMEDVLVGLAKEHATLIEPLGGDGTVRSPEA